MSGSRALAYTTSSRRVVDVPCHPLGGDAIDGGAISFDGIKGAEKKRPHSARAIPHARCQSRGGDAERGDERNAGRRQAPAASLIDAAGGRSASAAWAGESQPGLFAHAHAVIGRGPVANNATSGAPPQRFPQARRREGHLELRHAEGRQDVDRGIDQPRESPQHSSAPWATWAPRCARRSFPLWRPRRHGDGRRVHQTTPGGSANHARHPASGSAASSASIAARPMVSLTAPTRVSPGGTPTTPPVDDRWRARRVAGRQPKEGPRHGPAPPGRKVNRRRFLKTAAGRRRRRADRVVAEAPRARAGGGSHRPGPRRRAEPQARRRAQVGGAGGGGALRRAPGRVPLRPGPDAQQPRPLQPRRRPQDDHPRSRRELEGVGGRQDVHLQAARRGEVPRRHAVQLGRRGGHVLAHHLPAGGHGQHLQGPVRGGGEGRRRSTASTCGSCSRSRSRTSSSSSPPRR